MEQAHNWRKDEDVRTRLKAKVYARGFHFAVRDIIECVVGFRIDRHNIKRGTLMLNGYLSVVSCELTLHMHWP